MGQNFSNFPLIFFNHVSVVLVVEFFIKYFCSIELFTYLLVFFIQLFQLTSSFLSNLVKEFFLFFILLSQLHLFVHCLVFMKFRILFFDFFQLIYFTVEEFSWFYHQSPLLQLTTILIEKLVELREGFRFPLYLICLFLQTLQCLFKSLLVIYRKIESLFDSFIIFCLALLVLIDFHDLHDLHWLFKHVFESVELFLFQFVTW